VIALLGSGEFLPWAEEVDRLLIESAPNGSNRVLILPTASAPEGDEMFDKWGRMGEEHYRKIGAEPEVLPLKTREDAFRDEIVETVNGASLIFFSGGNPGYATNVLRGSPFWMAVLRAVRDGASFGGCSAGAGMLGATTPDVTSDVVANFRKMMWVEGLKLYPRLLIGAHWDALDSYVPGLTEFFIGSIPSGQTLLAMDEDTAVVGRGGHWTVHGRGRATVIRPGEPSQSYDTGSSFDLAESAEVIE
jgi:cyanophycinase